MKTLIIKLGATGDVVRTTTLIEVLKDEIYWITSDQNLIMLEGHPRIAECIPWSHAQKLKGNYFDLVINLEDSIEIAKFLRQINYATLFGAYLDNSDGLTYTEDSKEWFDLSLISRFGKEKADNLKYKNRKSYQEIIFKCLGHEFNGEKYYLPFVEGSSLSGDIAIADKSGDVWPMKVWAHYEKLKYELEKLGYIVNILPLRKNITEHIADIKNHKLLIGGDSLPMHIALGQNINCITIFQCTSPWEIHGYGIQKKIISPLLKKYFYKRDFNVEAVNCISLSEVKDIVIEAIKNTMSND